MNLPINKGPDFIPSQWIAAVAGLFVSFGVTHVLTEQGYLARNWAMVLVAAGFCVPPVIIGWLRARQRNVS
jgi:hypothetical protein